MANGFHSERISIIFGSMAPMNVEIIIWNSNEGEPLEWIKDKMLYNLAFVFGKGLLYKPGTASQVAFSVVFRKGT